MILEIISKVCSIFLIIGIGIAVSKCGLVPENSTTVLSKFLFNVVTPAVIITTMQGWNFEGQLVNDTIWSFASFTIVTLAIGLLSFVIVKPLRMPEQDKGICRMQLAFSNVGFMGIPLTKAVFGETAGLLILLMNTPFTILIYSFGVFLMLYHKGEEGINKELLKRMINLPLVVSLIGIVILASGFQLPEIINSGLEMIADTMVPVGMFIVGLQLSRTNLSSILNGRNIWMTVLSLVVVPLLTMGISTLLPQSGIVTVTLVFAMAMPAGTMCTVLAEEFQRNTLLASEVMALTTFLSLVTLPVWAIILTHFYAV